MITKTIKYVDYNGVEREEKFLFNLTKAELMEMEYQMFRWHIRKSREERL